MDITYYPKGVCSRMIEMTIEDGLIQDIHVTGGCSGNLQGICELCKGQPAKDVAQRLRGIRCGNKATSCPDQISKALEQAL